jgi:HEPN domain-containing protein
VSENFRVLARRRIGEARALQRAGEWSGAYYLAGYSVECALKACALKGMRRYHMPDKTMVADLHTHDLQKLVNKAELERSRVILAGADPTFAANWALVKDWNESSRYETWSEQDAGDLIQAITQRGSGVLGWIKKHW